jgi:uncharacterized protein
MFTLASGAGLGWIAGLDGGVGVSELGLNKAMVRWAILAGVVVLGAMALALWWMGPPPPKEVRMAGGAAGGVYAGTALSIAEALDAKKIRAEVLTTAGSIENLELLATGKADIGIVQTGLTEGRNVSRLRSLGGVFFEPLWVFHRADRTAVDLPDLRGMRVAVGPEGSGARVLADLLLAEAGLEPGSYTAAPLGGMAAADAVRKGDIDAALIVSSPGAPWIVDTIADPRVRLMSMIHGPGLARRHAFLEAVTLHRGVLDPARDLPASDITLVSPAAEIVVRDTLHPALQALLIEIAFREFEGGSLLSAPGAFPAPSTADIPLSEEARRYYKDGPTFLRRIFPYDVANLLERAWVLGIPLLTLVYPLVKAAPPVYRWRILRKIQNFYKRLRMLEAEARGAANPTELSAVRGRLAALQAEAGELDVPLAYADMIYSMREHIHFVAELADGLVWPQPMKVMSAE